MGQNYPKTTNFNVQTTVMQSNMIFLPQTSESFFEEQLNNTKIMHNKAKKVQVSDTTMMSKADRKSVV